MTLNTDYFPCPMDLDDSIDDYNPNLTNDSPKINQPYSNNYNQINRIPKEENKEPIYVMTVELGDGNSEAIKVFPDSDPQEVSFNFCKTHNLDIKSMNYLNGQLTELVEKFKKGIKDEGNKSIQEVDEEDYLSERIKTDKRENNNIITNKYEETKNKESLSLSDKYQKESHLNVVSGLNPAKQGRPVEKKIENENKTSEKNMQSNLNKFLHQKKEIHNLRDKIVTNKINVNRKGKNNSTNLFTYEIFDQTSNRHEIEHKHPYPKSSKSNKENIFNNKTVIRNMKNKSINTIMDERSEKNINENLTQMKQDNILGKLLKQSGVRNNLNNVILSSSIPSMQSLEKVNSNIMDNNKNHPNHKTTIDSTRTINLDQLLQPLSPVNRSPYSIIKIPCNQSEEINYGERLYQKNIKLQQETKRKLENFRKMREVEYRNKYSYKPHINSRSADIIKRRYENKIMFMLNNEEHNQHSLTDLLNDEHYFSAAWLENISHYDVHIEQKLEKLRKKHEKIEVYPFTPEINKKSQKIAEDKFKSKLNNLHSQIDKKLGENSKLDSISIQNARIKDLHNEWRLRSLKLDKMAENLYSQFSFKPHVNTGYNSEIVSMPFEQRQDILRKRAEDKLEKIENKNYPCVEKIRSSSSNINQRSIQHNQKHSSNIFNNLYSLAEKYSQEKYTKAKLIEEEMVKNMRTVHTLQPSDNMIQKKKIVSFKKIFKILDSDEDNVISSFYLDSEKLDKNILRIIQPILFELKEEQETLNEEEFVRACLHLYELIDYVDKRALIDFIRKNQIDKHKNKINSPYNFTFKPTIDRRSRKIAESRILNYDSINISENNNKREVISKSRIINNLNKQIEQIEEDDTENMIKEKDKYQLDLKEDSQDSKAKDIKIDKSQKQSEFNIDLIKSEIDKKYKKTIRGIQIKETSKDEKVYIPFKKEETRESTVKKVFVSESQIKEARNPEEKKKLLGVKREEIDRIKESKKIGLIEMQRELFSLPDNLQVQPSTKNDHVENLIKLSAAGLIEVPLPLEDKMKDMEEEKSVIEKKPIQAESIRVSDEISYLKFLKRIQPTYSKNYKSDISSKKIAKLNNVFENVFVPEKSRRKKLAKERLINENRKSEEI